MSARRLVVALILLVVGAGVAVALTPVARTWRATRSVASPEVERRHGAWSWLLAAPERRLDRNLRAIYDNLAQGGDDAVRDAAHRLSRTGRWTWDRPERAFSLRTCRVLTASDDAEDRRLAADLLAGIPGDTEPAGVLSLVSGLANDPDASIRLDALTAACGWAGLDRAPALAPLRFDDDQLERLLRLALSWRPAATEPGAPASPVGVLEAQMLHAALRGDTPIATLVDILERAGPPRPTIDTILRYASDPAAVAILTERGASGQASARFALQARDPERDGAQAERALISGGSPARRRLAAWRCRACPDGLRRAVLVLPPADPDGSVFAAALLAERLLPPDEASAHAQAWIRSFDDDEKRAGALLAALLGEHAELLERALAREDIPRVRTTQRLALIALGRDDESDEDPREFAHRTLRGEDGDFNPDSALCLLVAGEPAGIALLTLPVPAATDVGPALQRRAWLLERFLPDWHDAVGRPSGGDPRGADLYVDRLESLRLLCARRTRYDPVERIFVTTVMTPAHALAAPPPPADDGPP